MHRSLYYKLCVNVEVGMCCYHFVINANVYTYVLRPIWLIKWIWKYLLKGIHFNNLNGSPHCPSPPSPPPPSYNICCYTLKYILTFNWSLVLHVYVYFNLIDGIVHLSEWPPTTWTGIGITKAREQLELFWDIHSANQRTGINPRWSFPVQNAYACCKIGGLWTSIN